jgi:hypothetical protein
VFRASRPSGRNEEMSAGQSALSWPYISSDCRPAAATKSRLAHAGVGR